MKSTLTLKNLTKDYGKKRGVFDVSFTLNPKEIVGFLGPNGAGKTTTMDCLMGLRDSKFDSIKILGTEIHNHTDNAPLFSKVGYLPTDVFFDGELKVKTLLKMRNQLLKDNTYEEHIKIANELELDLDSKIRTLSIGNKKKVGLVLALAHNPDLIVLDEPTSGLDPIIKRKVWKLLQDAKERGSCIILSSHSLDEVEEISDRIIMIKAGKIIKDESTQQIMSEALKLFTIPLPKNKLKTKMSEEISKLDSTKHEYQNNGDLMVFTSDAKDILEILHKNEVYDFYLQRPRLEEMFLDEYKTDK